MTTFPRRSVTEKSAALLARIRFLFDRGYGVGEEMDRMFRPESEENFIV